MSDDEKQNKPPKAGPLDLTVDSKLKSIGLKKTVTSDKANANQAGAIRSPLMNPQGSKSSKNNSSNSSSSAQRKARPSPEARSAIKGFSNQAREVSKINFISAAHVGISDNYRRKRLVLLGSFVMLLIFGSVAAYFVSDDVRNFVRDSKKSITKLVDENYKSQKKRKYRVRRHQSKGQYRNRMAARKSVLTSNGDCKLLMASGYMFSEYKKMVLKDRLELAQCQLIYSDYKSVILALNAEKSAVRSRSEKALTNTELGQSVYYNLIALLKSNKMQEAEAMVNSSCRSWKESHACNGKLLVAAYRGFTNSGLKGFERLKKLPSGKLGGFANGWFFLAAAKLYQQAENYQLADKYFGMALNASKVKQQFLRKEIYESQAIASHQSGQILKLKRVSIRALKEFKGLDQSPKVKLLVLKEISNPSKAKSFLNSFLSKAELNVKARGDQELIDVIGPEVMKYNLHKPFLSFLRANKSHLGKSKVNLKSEMQHTMVWEVRSMMATNQIPAAIKQLSKIMIRYGSTPETQHLQGAAYLSGSESRNWALKAAKSFQMSLQKNRNWESMYGLGVALCRTGNASDATRVVKELEKMVNSNGQVYWLDMLRIEWYLATKRFGQADNAIKKWMRKNPEYLTPQKLNVKMLKLQKNDNQLHDAELHLDKLMVKRHFASSREGISSPLGSMSLRKRPLE